jgi:hypothetical protein
VLKAQHPEFELWNQGVHARSGVSCADCHMPYMREGATSRRSSRVDLAALVQHLADLHGSGLAICQPLYWRRMMWQLAHALGSVLKYDSPSA